MSGLMFPKQKIKKKRKKHKKSILHNRSDGTCYLCARLHNDYRVHRYLEEHHVFGGDPNRTISEAEGLKAYLCLEHHRTGEEAVHKNKQVRKMLQQDAQKSFEESHTREEFMKLFEKNYMED